MYQGSNEYLINIHFTIIQILKQATNYRITGNWHERKHSRVGHKQVISKKTFVDAITNRQFETKKYALNEMFCNNKFVNAQQNAKFTNVSFMPISRYTVFVFCFQQYNIILDKLNKILSNYLVQVAIFTNFKTVYSHYNSSSSHHSTKIIVILSESIAILPLLRAEYQFESQKNI